jgi:hypothetical protein
MATVERACGTPEIAFFGHFEVFCGKLPCGNQVLINRADSP